MGNGRWESYCITPVTLSFSPHHPPYPPPPSQDCVGNGRWEGYCIDLLNKLAADLQFNYTIELVEDGVYGIYNPETEEWNGMIRTLKNRVQT